MLTLNHFLHPYICVLHFLELILVYLLHREEIFYVPTKNVVQKIVIPNCQGLGFFTNPYSMSLLNKVLTVVTQTLTVEERNGLPTHKTLEE